MEFEHKQLKDYYLNPFLYISLFSILLILEPLLSPSIESTFLGSFTQMPVGFVLLLLSYNWLNKTQIID